MRLHLIKGFWHAVLRAAFAGFSALVALGAGEGDPQGSRDPAICLRLAEAQGEEFALL